ncbi:hypothetical protein M501DRAFT_1002486 [Patellaria atrata CBS 101060]|uniref:Uncharacterized protein n=1 Tax=Patellaria atrata CBS 101060 TaxID=1346257 RepID=A0A9P4SEK6_9PEZI|nr:hypothetical protein M501DRAFT_1002486 [Patellaria atrata CBS 101060]
MLRCRPTEITLTAGDINETFRRVDARKAAGYAYKNCPPPIHAMPLIKRGPERSVDKSMSEPLVSPSKLGFGFRAATSTTADDDLSEDDKDSTDSHARANQGVSLLRGKSDREPGSSPLKDQFGFSGFGKSAVPNSNDVTSVEDLSQRLSTQLGLDGNYDLSLTPLMRTRPPVTRVPSGNIVHPPRVSRSPMRIVDGMRHGDQSSPGLLSQPARRFRIRPNSEAAPYDDPPTSRDSRASGLRVPSSASGSRGTAAMWTHPTSVHTGSAQQPAQWRPHTEQRHDYRHHNSAGPSSRVRLHPSLEIPPPLRDEWYTFAQNAGHRSHQGPPFRHRAHTPHSMPRHSVPRAHPHVVGEMPNMREYMARNRINPTPHSRTVSLQPASPNNLHASPISEQSRSSPDLMARSGNVTPLSSSPDSHAPVSTNAVNEVLQNRYSPLERLELVPISILPPSAVPTPRPPRPTMTPSRSPMVVNGNMRTPPGERLRFPDFDTPDRTPRRLRGSPQNGQRSGRRTHGGEMPESHTSPLRERRMRRGGQRSDSVASVREAHEFRTPSRAARERQARTPRTVPVYRDYQD